MSMIDVSSSGLFNRPRVMKRHTGAPAQESRRRRAALRRLFVRWRSARTGCPAGSEGGELEAGLNAAGGSVRPSVAYSPKRLIRSLMYGERAAIAAGVISQPSLR